MPVPRCKEDGRDDCERVPGAFLHMMAGRNSGKQLVRL